MNTRNPQLIAAMCVLGLILVAGCSVEHDDTQVQGNTAAGAKAPATPPRQSSNIIVPTMNADAELMRKNAESINEVLTQYKRGE